MLFQGHEGLDATRSGSIPVDPPLPITPMTQPVYQKVRLQAILEKSFEDIFEKIVENICENIFKNVIKSIIETPRSLTCGKGTQLAALKGVQAAEGKARPLKLIKETLEVERNPAPAISKDSFKAIIKNILGVCQERLRGRHREDHWGHLQEHPKKHCQD
jgi:hypothetical protein